MSKKVQLICHFPNFSSSNSTSKMINKQKMIIELSSIISPPDISIISRENALQPTAQTLKKEFILNAQVVNESTPSLLQLLRFTSTVKCSWSTDRWCSNPCTYRCCCSPVRWICRHTCPFWTASGYIPCDIRSCLDPCS